MGEMLGYTPTELRKEIDVESVVTLHYYEHAKDYLFHGERHDFWELVYVDRGRMCGLTGDSVCELEQGQMIFIQPGEFHNMYGDGVNAFNVVIVTFVSKSPAMEQFRNKILYASAWQRELLGRVINEGKQAFDIATDRKSLARIDTAPFASEEMLKLSLEMLLVDIVRNEQPQDRRPKISSSVKRRADSDLVSRVICCMEDHLHESMSFAEICQYSAQSATNLKTIFKAVTGQGVMEYYRGMKITEAKTMLREGNGNITQIADKLGYSSIHYFSRHFKQATGMTPREYTQSVQAK